MKLFILRLLLLISRVTREDMPKGVIRRSRRFEKLLSKSPLYRLLPILLMVVLGLSCANTNAQTMTVTATSATTFHIQVNSDVYSWRVDEYKNGSWQELVRGDVWTTRSFDYSRPAGGTFYFHLYNCYNAPNTPCTTGATQSVTLTGNTPPSPPTVSTSIGNGSVVVSWNAPTGATSYQLSRNGTSLSPATSPYTDTGLSPGVSYTYNVIACNASSQCSTAGSSAITYPAVPAVPTISSSMSGANVVLSWSVPAGATSMQLLRGTTALPASGTSYTDSGVSAGSSYTYYLKACNAASVCSAAGTTTISVPPIPAVPTVSANFGGATATITWNNPTGTTSFQVQRNGSNVSYSGTSYYDNQLSAGSTYTYTVKACNVNNQCSAAGSASVVVPSGPLFQVDVTGNNSFRITVGNVYSWNPQESTDGGNTWSNLPAGSATSGITSVDYQRPGGTYYYRLYNCYNVANGCSTSSPKSVYLPGNPPPAMPSPSGSYSGSTITISWNQPSGAVSYNVTRDGVAVTPTGATYVDSVSAMGSVHTYSVKACNSTGECSSAASITYGLPPAAPTVTPTIGNASVILNWSAPAGAVRYEVSRGSTVLAGPSPAYTTTSLTDSSVVAGTGYTYSVVACNSINQCSAAGTGNITYPAVPSVTTFGAAVNGATVVASWTVSAGTHHVQLYRDTTQLSASSSPYTDSTIVAGNSYTYKLAACNAANLCSAFTSSPISVAAIPAVPTVNASFAGIVATVTWNVPAGTASFQVQRNGSNIAFSGSSLADSLSAPGTYTYTVKACNVNNQCSTAGSAQVVVPSGPMFQMDVTGNNTFRMLLANVYTWELQESRDGGTSWSKVDAGGTFNGVSQFSYSRAGGSYSYRIYNCYNVSGCGYTSPQSITLQGTPAPAAPTISASISGANINVSWTDTGYSYQFYRRLYPAAFVSYTASSRLAFSETGVAGASYQYGVQACNVTGECSAISRVDISKIANPSGVSATLNPRTAVVVVSTAAVTNATQYNIQRQLVGSGTWTTVYSGSNNAPSLPALTVAGSYIYQIQACNTPANDCSAWVQTNSVSVSSPGTPTLSLPSTSSTNSFTLSWGDVANAASYTVTEFTNGTQTNSFSQAGTTYTPTGKANATYTYKVYATNPIGSSSIASASINVAVVSAMGAVNATLNSSTGVTSLSWSGVTGATRYDVQPQLNGANSGAVQSFTTNTPTLPAVSVAGTYTYVVTACAVVGSYTNCGTPVTSNSVVLALPAAPTLTLPASTTTDGYTLSWAPISNAVTYVINESMWTAAGVDAAPITGTSQTYSGKSDAYYNYKVKACNLLGCGPYSAVSRVRVIALGTLGAVTATMNGATGVVTLSWAPISTTQYNIQPKLNGVNSGGVTASTVSTISLPAVSVAGTYTYSVSPYAWVDGYSNGPGNTVISNAVTLAVPPGTPAFVTPTQTSSTDGSYSFGWNAVSNTLNYVVNENGVDLTPAVTSPLTFSRTGKANGTYVYKVKACNVVGCTAYGPSINIDVVQITPVSNVNASLLQSTGVTTLSWTPVAAATYYSIQTKRNNAVYGSPVTSTSPTYIFPAVTEAGTYTYEVKACVTVGATTNCAAPIASNSVWPIQPDTPLLTTALFSSTGEYPVTWSTSLWATHYQLYENGTLIQDTGDWSKIFKGMTRKTNGTYFYTVKACWIVCSADSAQGVTIVSIPSASSGNPSAGTGTVFNFQTDAPSNFTYSLTSAGVPDLGSNQFVAATQGSMAVSNGSAQYSVKLDLPPAIRDLKPSLSLSYNSRSGNGIMGMGWSLSGLSSITRCRTSFAVESAEAQKSNPRYTNGDRLCLDGQKLVIASSSTPANDSTYWAVGAEYRTEIDTFSRIIAYSSDNGAHAYFKVFTKDGRTLTYGGETDGQNSRIRKPGDGNSVVGSWLLDKVEDSYGNSYTVTYSRDTANGNYYPDRINWGPNSAAKFEYHNRSGQIPSGYDMGGYYNFPKVLEKVTTYIDVQTPSDPTTGTAVKQYQINYKLGAATQRELVDTISECGYNAGAWQCAKPLTFTWQQGEFGFDDSQPKTAVYCSGGEITQDGDPINQVLDLDGDGYNDLLSSDVTWGTAAGCFSSPSYTFSTSAPPQGARIITQPLMTRSGYVLLIGTKLTSGQVEIGIVGSLKAAARSYTVITTLAKEFGGDAAAVDLNNDGLDDISAGGSSFIQLDQTSLAFVNGPSIIGPHTVGTPNYVDLTGDGVKDSIFSEGNTIQIVSHEGAYSPVFTVNPTADYLISWGSCYGGVRMLLSGGLTRVVADVNGDGQKDYVFFHHNDNPISTSNPNGGKYEWMYRLNLQNATSDEVNTHVVHPNGPNSTYPANVYSYGYDWDKDGRDDVLDLADPSNCRQRVLLSRDSGNQTTFTELKDSAGNTYTTNILGGSICAPVYDARTANIFKGDINNDGALDIWTSSKTIYYGKPQQPDLLVRVVDGFGVPTKVEYSTLVGDDNNGKPLYTPDAVPPTFPQIPAGRNLQVVKKLSVGNGQGGFNNRFFNYTGARADIQGRGFLGFANIQVTDDANSTITSTDYRLGFPFNGRVDTVTSKAVSGNLISSTKNVYAIQDSNARFPYLSYSIQKGYQLTTTDPNQPLSAVKIQNTYDACGNLTEKVSDAGTGVSGSLITGLLSHQRIVNQINSYAANDCSDDFIEQTTQETSKTSTSDDFRSVVTAFTPSNTNFNKPKEIATTTAYKGTALEHTTSITRSASGLVTGSQESAKDIDNGTVATRSVTTSNFMHGMYPQTVTTSLSGGDMVTSTAFDMRFGEAEYVKSPNGLATTRVFDSFGRVVDEYLPDMTRRELVAFYCSSMSAVTCPSNAVYGVATRVTNTFLAGSLGAPLSIVYYDNHQRPVRNTTYTLNGSSINVDRVYRADGKIDKISEPYDGSGSATAWSTFADYDELGVPHSETAADGGSRTSTFDRSGNSYHITQTVSVVKSTGTDTQISERFINPLGQVEKVIDALNTPVNYTYNSLGNLATTQVNNNASTQISITYDVAGNKSNMVDPDAGSIDFEYNGFGELRRQTWQKGTSFAKSMTLNYDQLGRQVTRVDQPVSGSSTSYQWVWDSQQKGLLSSVSGNGQSISYAYDELGRLSAMNTSIGGTSDKLFTYTYDAFSRPATVVYPNGLSIQRVYHAAGMAVQTQDISDPANPKVLWALGSDVDSRGSFTNQLWGNGVVTQTGFDALNGQLKSIKSGHLTTTNTINNLAGDIQNLTYVIDSIGNLESRNTQRTNGAGVALENTTEQFTYDRLNRLKTSTSSGLFARSDSYDYDELGNLKNRASYIGSSSTNNDVGALAYAGTNGAGVHAVTSAGGVTYQYDKYGNMIQRGAESITYDVFNKPIRIGNMLATTTIDYDANHDRFRESDGSSTTYTIAGGLYEEIVTGSASTQKSYIDGVIINTKVFNSGSLASNDTQYVHTDHLGSSEAISDKFGALVNRMSFSDWGNRQKADWSTGAPALNFPTNNGYTGQHELDKHNLVHMGGRVYDPRIGRFLSADLLVQSPYSTQSFNRYTYVANNPMSRNDPTGYCNNPASTAHDGDGNLIPTFELPCDGDHFDLNDNPWYHQDNGGTANYWQQNSNVVTQESAAPAWLPNNITTSVGSPIDPSMDVTQWDGNVLADATVPGWGAWDCISNGCDGLGWALGGLSLVPEITLLKDLGVLGKTTKTENGVLKELSRVPGRVQSRINISNEGIRHTLERHLNPARASNKSQFTIPESELRELLNAKSTIQTPVEALETGNFARTVTVDKTIGNLAEKMGGESTNTFTVITDKFGNLQTAFPGGW